MKKTTARKHEKIVAAAPPDSDAMNEQAAIQELENELAREDSPDSDE